MATIYCMRCGQALDPDALRCPSCGTPTLRGIGLADPEDEVQVSCPVCGEPNDAWRATCSACGAPLVASDDDQAAAEDTPAIAPNEPQLVTERSQDDAPYAVPAEASERFQQVARHAAPEPIPVISHVPRPAELQVQEQPKVKQPKVKQPKAERANVRKPAKRTKRLSEGTRRALATCGIIAAVCLFVGALAYGLRSGGDPQPQKAQDQQAQQAAKPEPAPQPTSADVVAQMTLADVPVRDALGDYSWIELAVLGRQMSACASRDEAYAIAHDYHIVDDGYYMTTQAKNVTIDGVGSVPMRVVDIYHDDLSTGGKAGMTFLANQIVLTHHMKDTGDNTGGWEGSRMRAWLNGEVLQAMDRELAPLVVSVNKYTNNVGKTTSQSAVSATADKLWIPSACELGGEMSWNWDEDPVNSGAYNQLLSAEGSRYAYFAEQYPFSTYGNACRSLAGPDGGVPVTWWMRSAYASNAQQYCLIGTDGGRTLRSPAIDVQGVCLGFCL